MVQKPACRVGFSPERCSWVTREASARMWRHDGGEGIQGERLRAAADSLRGPQPSSRSARSRPVGYYDTAQFTGTLSAYGGAGYQAGAAGTVYTKCRVPSPSLSPAVAVTSRRFAFLEPSKNLSPRCPPSYPPNGSQKAQFYPCDKFRAGTIAAPARTGRVLGFRVNGDSCPAATQAQNP